MDIEDFKKHYTPTMMEIVKKFDEIQSIKFAEIIRQSDYTKLQIVKHGMEQLCQAKMLLIEYERAMAEKV
jgi:hypothetical protein